MQMPNDCPSRVGLEQEDVSVDPEKHILDLRSSD
jgi:hypothetical protein